MWKGQSDFQEPRASSQQGKGPSVQQVRGTELGSVPSPVPLGGNAARLTPEFQPCETLGREPRRAGPGF